jgi:hypothetical protein
MTELLQKAFERASSLPDAVQDLIAEEWLGELESESRWDEAFARSQDKLAQLAKQALTDLKSGRGEHKGFDEV